MTIGEYLSNILSAVRGTRTIEQQEDVKLATLVSEQVAIRVRLTAIEASAAATVQGVVTLHDDQTNLADRQRLMQGAIDTQALALMFIEQTQDQHTILLKQILAALKTIPGPAVKCTFTISDPETGEILFEGDSPMQANQARHTRRHVKITLKDADGNVTKLDQIDTPSTITSANAAVTIENFSVDTMEFDTVTGALAGIGPVSLNGDADLEAGKTTPFTGTLDITVPPGNAVVAEFEVGPETPA